MNLNDELKVTERNTNSSVLRENEDNASSTSEPKSLNAGCVILDYPSWWKNCGENLKGLKICGLLAFLLIVAQQTYYYTNTREVKHLHPHERFENLTRKRRQVNSQYTNLDDRPAVYCYQCDNYAALSKAGKKDLAMLGGHPVYGGLTYVGNNPNKLQFGDLEKASLCAEKTDRTKIHKLLDPDDEEDGKCSGNHNDGCYKMVTKSYRIQAHTGKKVRIATVVSRSCAVIPRGYGEGCHSFTGGAGVEQVICYCRGDFCNKSGKHSFNWMLATGVYVGFALILKHLQLD